MSKRILIPPSAAGGESPQLDFTKPSIVRGLFTPNTTNTGLNSSGILANTADSGGVQSADIDADGAFFNIGPGTTNGAEGGMDVLPTEGRMSVGLNSQMLFLFKLPNAESVASIRFWACLTDTIRATMVSNDDPAGGDFVGIRFSNPGDSVYQFAAKEGTTLTLAASSVTPVAGTFIAVRIKLKAAARTALVEILNPSVNPAAVLDSHTFTDLESPANGQAMGWVAGQENRAAKATSPAIQIYRGEAFNDPLNLVA